MLGLKQLLEMLIGIRNLLPQPDDPGIRKILCPIYKPIRPADFKISFPVIFDVFGVYGLIINFHLY